MSWLAAALAALSSVSGQAQPPSTAYTVFTVDDSHALLDFTTRLIGFNRVRGRFEAWRADFLYHPTKPTASAVFFVAEIASLATGDPERDTHLKTADFFDAGRRPLASFEGQVVAATATRLEIEGRLAIRDSVRLIRFPVTLVTPETTDPFGNRRLVFAGQVSLNRRDFGVNGPPFWSRAIADSVTLEIELPGRVWNYRSRSFQAQAYYGPALVAASDSGRFDGTYRRLRSELAQDPDSARWPRAEETAVAVGRLIQAGKPAQALSLLELVADRAAQRWNPTQLSFLEARFGEVLVRLGRQAEARQRLERAIALDPANTNAKAWLAAAAARTL